MGYAENGGEGGEERGGAPRGNFAVELSSTPGFAVYHLPGTYEIHPS